MSTLSIHTDDRSREHGWDDCWCGPTVERFNHKTGEWETV